MFDKIRKRFSLEGEQDSPQIIHDNIMSGVVFEGTNLWILMIAIVIASVGLNVNSTAVIIGAMLISPLMGPIIGMGYGLGTYDFDLVRQSIKNYFFAVVTGLAVSTLYFSASPLNEAHSELLARTTPTIYDVLIAFFGGLAGFIAIVSRYKGNVITGVAIATALMPPLCTAGYGVATSQWSFFIGALYLLAINTVFIALSALVTTRLFGQPLIQQATPEKKQAANRYVTAIVFLTLIPSVYLGITFIRQDQFERQAKLFVSQIKIDNNYLLKYDINPARKRIALTFGGIGLNDLQKTELTQRLAQQGLDAELNIQQGFSFAQLGDINSQTELLRNELSHLREDLITLKKNQQKINTVKESLAQNMLAEIHGIFPQVVALSLAQIEQSTTNDSPAPRLLLVQLNDKSANKPALTSALTKWAQQRLHEDNILVLVQPESLSDSR